jgi:hypothetical protein
MAWAWACMWYAWAARQGNNNVQMLGFGAGRAKWMARATGRREAT